MPQQPGLSEVHADSALTELSVAYIQSTGNFVADKVFPPVPVANRSNRYHIFDKTAFLRAGGEKTPYGVEAPRGGLKLSQDSYGCEIYRWAFDLTNDLKVNADKAVSIETAAVNYVTNSLLVRREALFIQKYFATGVWGTDVTPATKWDASLTGTPLADIRLGRTAVLQATGFMPNTLVVSQQVHDQLSNHPNVVDRYKYTTAESITPQMLARLFEVDRYIVARGVQVTSQEGQTTATGFIAGKNALLCYAPPQPGLMTPSAGYTFVWQGLTNQNDMGVRVNRIAMDWLGMGTERIEAEMAFDLKVTGADLGYFFNAAVS
jgi:Phage major capsid protein E